MSRVRRHEQKASDRGKYASKEEFVSVFESERADLQRLALLLTANSEAAKRCLSRAFRDCIATSSVFKEWVHSWARRMVIRNAISLVMSPEGESFGHSNDEADKPLIAFSADALGATATTESILDLSDFERFVAVICVFERYSIHDCALLLGRSPREVNEARHRVSNRIGQIDEFGYNSRHFGIC